MKIGKVLQFAAGVAVAALCAKKATRPIGPCSPELELRCDIVNENKAAIDAWRAAHPDTKLGDYDIWNTYLRNN